jgi:predicted  nucleic acid-binding Zn-ribbon protein
MTGLLSRMKEIRRNLGLSEPVSQGMPEDPDRGLEGVSKDELDNINRKIEEVAASNRIDVTGDTFKISAARRGIALPLLVNIGSLIVLAGGIGLMFLLFQQSETSLDREIQSLASTEGRLLEVLRQEAEANLAAKEAEIAAIQAQLQQIESERDSLAANFESQLATREAQLRATLDAELETERARLRELGLTAEEIEAEIERLRQEKETALAQALAQYEAELQAERDRAEAALAQVEAEASASLVAANEIRAELEAEAQAREAELQAQLQAAQQASQAAQDEADQQVQAARDALAALNAQREQEQTLSSQLNGFYSQIRTQINNGNYPQAEETLQLLRNFLNSQQFLAVESLAQRRDTEVFIANALSQLITTSQRRSAETASLAQTASLVTEIREIVGQANDLSTGGQREQALELYREAIELVPEISTAYQAVLSEENRSLQSDLETQVGQAEAAIAQELEAEYAAQLSELETRLSEEIQALEAELSSRDQTIARRDAVIASRDGEIVQLNSEIETLNTDIIALRAEIAQRDEAISNNQSRLAEIQENLGDEAAGLLEQLDASLLRLEGIRSDLGVNSDEEIEGAIESLQADRQRLADIRQQLDVEGNLDIIPAIEQIQQDNARIAVLEQTANRLEAIEDDLAELGIEAEEAAETIRQLQLVAANERGALEAFFQSLDPYRLRYDLIPAREEASNLDSDAILTRAGELVQAQAERIALFEQDPEAVALSSAQLDELEQQLESLNNDLERGRALLARRDQTISDLESQIADLENEIDSLDAQLTSTIDAAAQSRQENLQQIRELTGEKSDLTAELNERTDQLEAAVARYTALTDAYRDYRIAENRAINTAASEADRFLLGKTALDRFLVDEAVQAAFPGLIDRIKAYDQAFQRAGQETIVYAMAEEIYAVYSYGTANARLNYIDEQIAATDDPAMIEFFGNLRRIILEE